MVSFYVNRIAFILRILLAYLVSAAWFSLNCYILRYVSRGDWGVRDLADNILPLVTQHLWPRIPGTQHNVLYIRQYKTDLIVAGYIEIIICYVLLNFTKYHVVSNLRMLAFGLALTCFAVLVTDYI